MCKATYSQVLAWNSATRTGVAPNYTYTGTGIKAVVTTNAVTLGDGTPRVDGVSGFSACYLTPGLDLYAGFFNSYIAGTNSHITTTFSFATGFGCTDVTFIIKDINSGESFTDFCDVLELSATYNNSGTALPVANITTTLASNVNRTTSGTTVKLVGHNSSTETTGAYTSGTACGSTTVKITPPAGMPLNTFTIKYRPAYGTSTANAYYTSGTHPAAQYVSYGNLTFVATSGCAQLLPIELISFQAIRKSNTINLKWETASEINNNYFSIERSFDGLNFETIDKVIGVGNSLTLNKYEYNDGKPSRELSYYRLKQTDFNGEFKYSNILSIESDNSKAFICHIFPNPTSTTINFEFYTPIEGEINYEITDCIGRLVISKTQLMEIGYSKISTPIGELPKGIYFLKVHFDKTNLNTVNKIVKN